MFETFTFKIFFASTVTFVNMDLNLWIRYLAPAATPYPRSDEQWARLR